MRRRGRSHRQQGREEGKKEREKSLRPRMGTSTYIIHSSMVGTTDLVELIALVEDDGGKSDVEESLRIENGLCSDLWT